jgi:hypothetical protein
MKEEEGGSLDEAVLPHTNLIQTKVKPNLGPELFNLDRNRTFQLSNTACTGEGKGKLKSMR